MKAVRKRRPPKAPIAYPLSYACGHRGPPSIDGHHAATLRDCPVCTLEYRSYRAPAIMTIHVKSTGRTISFAIPKHAQLQLRDQQRRKRARRR
jgi:hypothetical protein